MTATKSRRAVVGIAFDEDVTRVLLIEKQRPKWQKGYFNGVGGKVEPGEEPRGAMAREFKEETGLQVNADSWDYVVNYRGLDFEIYFYRVFLPNEMFAAAKTMTDEQVVPTPLAQIPSTRTIYNLQFIIPMVMDANVRFPISIEKKQQPGAR